MVSELQEPSMASIASTPLQKHSSSSTQVPLPSTLAPVSVRLDRSNYLLWRSQILPTDRAYGWEEFLLGTNSKPERFLASSTSSDQPTAPASLEQVLVNPAFLQWTHLDQFLLSWILSSISEPMLGHVIQCTSASGIWKLLEQLFATKSKARHLRI